MHSFGDGFSVIAKMIGSLSKLANRPIQLTKFNEFANNAKKLKLTAIENSIRLVIPEVSNNVHWRETAYNELEKYLHLLMNHLKIN